VKQLTPRLKSVYDCIKSSPTPPGAYDLLERLRSQGFKAPSQIYRALNQLLELELIHRVESLNSFIACDQKHQSGTWILAVCDNCGTVTELPSLELSEQIKALSDRHAFKSRELAIELKGQCAKCN